MAVEWIAGSNKGLRHYANLLAKIILSLIYGDGYSDNALSTFESHYEISAHSLFFSNIDNRYTRALFNWLVFDTILF